MKKRNGTEETLTSVNTFEEINEHRTFMKAYIRFSVLT